MKHLSVKTEVKDFVFTDHPVIFPEPLEVLVMTLEALHEEVKPLGLKGFLGQDQGPGVWRHAG